MDVRGNGACARGRFIVEHEQHEHFEGLCRNRCGQTLRNPWRYADSKGPHLHSSSAHRGFVVIHPLGDHAQ